jgi:hypothetical protein
VFVFRRIRMHVPALGHRDTSMNRTEVDIRMIVRYADVAEERAGGRGTETRRNPVDLPEKVVSVIASGSAHETELTRMSPH